MSSEYITIVASLYLLFLFAAGVKRKRRVFTQITTKDEYPFDDILSQYAYKENEIAVAVMLLALGFLASVPTTILLALMCACLIASSICDIKTNQISDILLLPIFLLSCQVGLNSGRYILTTIIAVLYLIYICGIGDSDIFGGADAIIMLSGFSALGVFYGIIFMIIASAVGILQKAALWITKKDNLDNRGVAFVPALTIGIIISLVMSQIYGEIITISLTDMKYLYQYIKGA